LQYNNSPREFWNQIRGKQNLTKIGELLKSLIESETEKKNEFYDLFFNKCLKRLSEFLTIHLKPEFKYEMLSSKQIIIEIICHCFKSHSQRTRYWTIHNDLVPKILDLQKDNSKIILLQVIKFMKTLIVYGDDNIIKLITSNDYLNDIIKIYSSISNKDNLIISAILELFDIIKRNNMKKLIAYLFEKHYDFFYKEEHRNVTIFQDLIAKYDQGLEGFSYNRVDENSNTRIFKEFRSEMEEQYFDDDDEEEDDLKDYWDNKKKQLFQDSFSRSDRSENIMLNRKKYSDTKLEDIFKDLKEDEEELYRQLSIYLLI
jgi:hypothetical protein